MKTIIIPTDFSDNALNAAEYGFALAHQLDAKVLLFHSYHLPDITSEIPIYIPTLTDLTAQYIGQLEIIGHQLKEKHHVQLEYCVKMGFFLDQLSQIVESIPDSLVVMGMRGANRLERKVLGTTTTAVLQQAAFPVLVVPKDAHFQPINHIVFACDYATLSMDNPLTWLKDIAQIGQAKVQVLHIALPEVTTPHVSWMEEGAHIERVLHGVDRLFSQIEGESVWEGIEQGIESHHANLLVMVPQKHNFWDVITGHSNTHKIVFKTPIPLLALPNPLHEGTPENISQRSPRA